MGARTSRILTYREHLLSNQTVSDTGIPTACAGISSILFYVSGNYTGSVTFVGSIDDTNFVAIPCINLTTGLTETSTTSTGLWLVPFGALTSVNATTILSGGSVSVDVSLGEQPSSNPYAGAFNPDVTIGAVSINQSATATGWTPFRFTTNLDTVGNQIKGTAGNLGYLNLVNPDES